MVKIISRIITVLALALRALPAHAQAYGQGPYNGFTYGGNAATGAQAAGGLLPVTGPQLVMLGSALLIAAAVGLVVWMRKRKKAAQAPVAE